MKRKIGIFIFSVVLVIALGLYLWSVLSNHTNKTIDNKINQTSQVDVPNSETKKFVDNAKSEQEETKKASEFIAKMMGEDSIVDFHFKKKVDENAPAKDTEQSNGRKEVMKQFFAGIKEKEPELFAGAYDTTQLMPAFSADYELTPEGIAKEHLRIINQLSKNDTFTNGTYTFTNKDSGEMTFNYKDGSSYKIPFQLHEYSDGHSEDSYFVIVTPITDILKGIK